METYTPRIHESTEVKRTNFILKIDTLSRNHKSSIDHIPCTKFYPFFAWSGTHVTVDVPKWPNPICFFSYCRAFQPFCSFFFWLLFSSYCVVLSSCRYQFGSRYEDVVAHDDGR